LTRALALAVLACLVAALAPGATAASAAACPNEQLREESNVNPATGHRYSTELPECRAYEMVSPLFKQAHGAGVSTLYGTPVAPNGETVGFASEGDFSEPENYKVNAFHATNFYLSQRGASGWMTASAFAPHRLVGNAIQIGLDSDLSPDMRSRQLSCGANVVASGEGWGSAPIEACAIREPSGACFAPLPIPVGCWASTNFTTVNDLPIGGELTAYLGGSSDLSRVFLDPPAVLPTTEGPQPKGLNTAQSIYELEGAGGASPQLRLVNRDSHEKELVGNETEPGIPASNEPPKLGDNSVQESVNGGSSYHAISDTGEKVFFAALANENEEGEENKEVQTLYARVAHTQTVTISAPECSTALCKAAKRTSFEGASADGSKVFFTTEQPLVEGDGDETLDLYEYDFTKPVGHRLIQVSAGEVNPEHKEQGKGAEVQGVVRTSSDGSHLYFVALGVLTSNPNANSEHAKLGADNLYGYDTVTGETKFVAQLPAGNQLLWGHGPKEKEDQQKRDAQTTPNGSDLVFSAFGQLAGDTNSASVQAVYRYDFASGALQWLSRGAPGSAVVNPLARARGGAMASIDDWARAISDNGEYVIFTTAETLQTGTGGLYLWHNGTVSRIARDGGETAAISSSGSDIFFATGVQLVGQDTDSLVDFYDARVNGGFPAPVAEPSCQAEACQGEPSRPPTFASPPSSSFPAGGNLTPTAISVAGSTESKGKTLTPAQQLALALKACKSKPKSKRAPCESQARKKYRAQLLAVALKACKSKPKSSRAACESQARKRYR
jgi:hypothetical protein